MLSDIGFNPRGQRWALLHPPPPINKQLFSCLFFIIFYSSCKMQEGKNKTKNWSHVFSRLKGGLLLLQPNSVPLHSFPTFSSSSSSSSSVSEEDELQCIWSVAPPDMHHHCLIRLNPPVTSQWITPICKLFIFGKIYLFHRSLSWF